MDELYQEIIDSFMETGSVKRTAEELGTYPIKVRRVLITEGLWKSKTSEKVAELMAIGMNTAEIAGELYMSEKTVQSYMPYSRGQYGGENRSNEAIRSEIYRERMQTAAEKQVTNTEARSKKKEDEQKRHMEEMRAERERLLKEQEKLKKELEILWNRVESEMNRIPMALQLHLELDLGYFDEENREILQKYGKMKKGISRDFIVPGSMTLHALHYAIMKAFGWQNSHLHCYVPYEDEFQKMTDGGLVKEWTRQVGMYFRFPSGHYEDLYWDDDYEEGESIKTWLKSKYCGPYTYEGIEENYIPAQIEVDRFRKKCPEIQKKTTDQRTWNVYMEGQCEELLERLPIWTVLQTPADKVDWDSWREEKELELRQAEKERSFAIQRYKMIRQEFDTVMKEVETYFDEAGNLKGNIGPYIEKMNQLSYDLDTLCDEHNPEPVPVLSALCYRYDYGDDWEIRITCTNAWYNKSEYKRDENGNMCYDRNGFITEKDLFVDTFGEQIDAEIVEKIQEIAKKEKPVCIGWDGMNLVDDVGGINGFCEFLETINGDDPEQKKRYKTWARSLGWTGRMPKPDNML